MRGAVVVWGAFAPPAETRVPPHGPEAHLHVGRFLLYIDPGSGSLLLQAFIAAVLSGAVMGRKAIGDFFSRLFRKRTDRE